MNTSMNIAKDTLLLSTLIVVAVTMVLLSPLLASREAHAVIDSASSIAQSVSTPTAMQPILYREAAIIVTAPRIRNDRLAV